MVPLHEDVPRVEVGHGITRDDEGRCYVTSKVEEVSWPPTFCRNVWIHMDSVFCLKKLVLIGNGLWGAELSGRCIS